MRKLASIVTIATADPIPETDRLDVVTLNGKAWRIVTGRNEFRPGDRAVYFEIDSALPVDDERYAFLHDRCLRSWSDKHGKTIKQAVRIRTVKLREVISQGLVMPAGLFPEQDDRNIGDDVTSVLRVEHFDEIQEQMRAMLDTRTRSTGRREGNFPTFIPKTDEERIQNLADWPEKLRGVRWEVTEKNDGSSMTVQPLVAVQARQILRGDRVEDAPDLSLRGAADVRVEALHQAIAFQDGRPPEPCAGASLAHPRPVEVAAVCEVEVSCFSHFSSPSWWGRLNRPPRPFRSIRTCRCRP